MAFTGASTKFPSLEKIDFTKVMEGMKFNRQNWLKFYGIFMRNIQSYVPKELLTTGFFSRSKHTEYQRIDTMATIVDNSGQHDLYREQYNIVYMKQLCDWHNGARTPPDSLPKPGQGNLQVDWPNATDSEEAPSKQ
ncbi:14313_t:CDS:2, partial [Racocetra persica]